MTDQLAKGMALPQEKRSGKRKTTKSTSTSAFGVSRREGHDSRSFYARFEPPTLSSASNVAWPSKVDEIYHGDARSMDKVDDNSVALVVTSPPYFAGKAYEEALGEGHIPASYFEYLEMLYQVFRECVDKLEDGGRIAVNVANLGRRPYRSLSSDVIDILQNRLHLLLRGEVVWQKARGATGSCAWGSFQSPVNPVLRDVTERIIIASKGRFDRALSRKERSAVARPSDVSIYKEEFMEATMDVWDIAPESATRVNHPAPFPVELPERLINLYTFSGDLVLDPFMGSGTTAVAALNTGRHYVGYDTEKAYVEAAKKRVQVERKRVASAASSPLPQLSVTKAVRNDDETFQERAVREGHSANELAEELLKQSGFDDIVRNKKVGPGIEVDFSARGRDGKLWHFEVSGAFTSSRAGLRKAETLWKALGKAGVLNAQSPDARLVLLTTNLPVRGSAGQKALAAVQGAAKGNLVYDVVEIQTEEGWQRLSELAGRKRRRVAK